MRKNVFYKILSGVMLVVMAMSICSCSFPDGFNPGKTKAAGILTSQELIRNVINAINDEKSMAECYSSIPESQLDDVSYSMFFEYISIIRTISSKNARNVSFFRLISDAEKREVVGEALLATYPGLIGAELQYADSDGAARSVDYPLYIFLVQKNNTASLSRRWISGVIDIYNYGDHYFSLLDDNNTDGVYTLISPGSQLNGYNEAATRAMAGKLVDYYRVNVKSSHDQYRISRLTPNQYTVVIPETIGDEEEYTDHIVDITRTPDYIYCIHDVVPLELDSSFLYLRDYVDNGSGMEGEDENNSSSQILLRLGSTYAHRSIGMIVGQRVNYEFSRTDISAYMENDQGVSIPLRRTIVMFDNLTLIFNSDVQGDDWSGVFVEFSITGEGFCVGDQIHVGMSLNDVLAHYPYMDEYGYEYVIEDTTGIYTIEFVFDDNDILTSISLCKNP